MLACVLLEAETAALCPSRGDKPVYELETVDDVTCPGAIAHHEVGLVHSPEDCRKPTTHCLYT